MEKEFLSPSFNPEEILSVSTFKPRCITSGEFYLHGLYPLEDLKYNTCHKPHGNEFSPLNGTMFEKVLNNIEEGS